MSKMWREIGRDLQIIFFSNNKTINKKGKTKKRIISNEKQRKNHPDFKVKQYITSKKTNEIKRILKKMK